MDLMIGDLSGCTAKPVCKYGRRCTRKNPKHFVDFDHLGLEPPTRAQCPSKLFARACSNIAIGKTANQQRRCKFGCGLPAYQDATRIYDTCCRSCGLCQGAGKHDKRCAGGYVQYDTEWSNNGDFTNPELSAFMAIEHALELRQQAKSFAASGNMERMQNFLLDSIEQLNSARALIPAGHKLEELVTVVLSAWDHVNKGILEDDTKLGALEREVDQLLDQIVTELDAALFEAMKSKPNSDAFSGTGSSDSSTSLVPAGPEFAQPRTAACAQAALRVLGLDDEWPTHLTIKEIRRRYMREAMRTHPDKCPPEEREVCTAQFQEIAEAYSTLEIYMTVLEHAMTNDGKSNKNDLQRKLPLPPVLEDTPVLMGPVLSDLPINTLPREGASTAPLDKLPSTTIVAAAQDPPTDTILAAHHGKTIPTDTQSESVYYAKPPNALPQDTLPGTGSIFSWMFSHTLLKGCTGTGAT